MKITLKAARTNAGLTQSGIADKIGVSAVTIARWESGKSCPTVPQFKKYCSICNVDMSDIVV